MLVAYEKKGMFNKNAYYNSIAFTMHTNYIFRCVPSYGIYLCTEFFIFFYFSSSFFLVCGSVVFAFLFLLLFDNGILVHCNALHKCVP